MGIIYLTYSYALLFISVLISEGFAESNILNSSPSPYRFILYSTLVVAVVYMFVRSQTRSLIKTKKLLKEKEISYNIIERQKSELEYKDKNITDSLIYAQRIQEALLPSESYFRKYIEDSFVFFKPKDIVSGDFYWIGENEGKVFIVAADCTGHGVPGALMSMIGLDIVERAINIQNIQSPSQILNLLNNDLEKIFSREKNFGSVIRDGMDIGLCIIDLKNRKMKFAGAFFPLYLIRNSTLTETKGDKLIIGMNPEPHPYSDNEIDILEDDIFYLFSDGYVDQFGGSEMKKFMYRRFRYLLLTIHKFPVNDQKSILDDNIRTWMGGDTQVDDMMVIGFRPYGLKN